MLICKFLVNNYRGSFNIWNKEYNNIEDLIAHISNKACYKVYKAACEFQQVLELEMLPKSDIWPKSFMTAEPSGDSIALYFFPSKTRYQFLSSIFSLLTFCSLIDLIF